MISNNQYICKNLKDVKQILYDKINDNKSISFNQERQRSKKSTDFLYQCLSFEFFTLFYDIFIA